MFVLLSLHRPPPLLKICLPRLPCLPIVLNPLYPSPKRLPRFPCLPSLLKVLDFNIFCSGCPLSPRTNGYHAYHVIHTNHIHQILYPCNKNGYSANLQRRSCDSHCSSPGVSLYMVIYYLSPPLFLHILSPIVKYSTSTTIGSFQSSRNS